MSWGCTLDLHCSTLFLGSFVPGFAFVCLFFLRDHLVLVLVSGSGLGFWRLWKGYGRSEGCIGGLHVSWQYPVVTVQSAFFLFFFVGKGPWKSSCIINH